MQLIQMHSISLGILLCAQAVSAQSLQQYTLVKSGDVLPGLPSGVTIERMGTPAVSKDGDIAFVAWLQGEGIITGQNDSGIWRQVDGGDFELLARTGDQAPGVDDGLVYDIIQRPNINRYGRVAFNASLRGEGIDSSNNIGFWSDGLTPSIRLVARLGDPAPGTEPGTVFSFFGNDYALAQTRPYFSDSGVMTLAATLSGSAVTTENDRGLWVGNAGAFALELRAGDSAVPPYEAYTIETVGSSQINSSNDLFSYIALAGPGVDTSNNGVVIVKRGGNGWQALIRSGDHAPGMPSDVLLRSVHLGGITDDGRVSIHSRLISEQYDNPGDGANWQEMPDGQLRLTLFTDMPGPWNPDDVVIESVASSRLGRVRTTQYSSFFEAGQGMKRCLLDIGSDGSVKLLHFQDEQAAGLDAGVLYYSFPSIGDNSVGWYFISAKLSGSGVDSTNDKGLWLCHDGMTPLLVARTGETVDLDDSPAGNDLRVISDLYTLLGSGGEDGRRRNLSDNNRLAYLLYFTDGTRAIRVAKVVCIADVNGDGIVSPADFSAWVAAFNAQASECDQNGDGSCTPADFSAWVANYNAGCS